jgi:hypothetical protein
VNYKRGFNRVFLLLWALWAFGLLVVGPFWFATLISHDMHEIAEATRQDADDAALDAREAERFIEDAARQEADASLPRCMVFAYQHGVSWPLVLRSALVLPAVAYALLWIVLNAVACGVAGFRRTDGND